MKHLHVGAFDYLSQLVIGGTGGNSSRDAQFKVGMVLVVERDEFREQRENGLPRPVYNGDDSRAKANDRITTPRSVAPLRCARICTVRPTASSASHASRA